ncbi:MAG: hypothetical protein ACK4IT_09630 [Thioalkalivibrionaceae bacterium]
MLLEHRASSSTHEHRPVLLTQPARTPPIDASPTATTAPQAIRHHEGASVFELDGFTWSRFDESGQMREYIAGRHLVQPTQDGEQRLYDVSITLRPSVLPNDTQSASDLSAWLWQAHEATHDPSERAVQTHHATLGWQYPIALEAPAGFRIGSNSIVSTNDDGPTGAAVIQTHHDEWWQSVTALNSESDRDRLTHLRTGLIGAPPVTFLRGLSGADVRIDLTARADSAPESSDPEIRETKPSGRDSTTGGLTDDGQPAATLITSTAPILVVEVDQQARATGWQLDRARAQLKLFDHVQLRRFGEFPFTQNRHP